MKRKILTGLIVLMNVLAFSSIQAQDLEGLVEEISIEIQLDENQKQSLEKGMIDYTKSLQQIFDKYESGEPDPQAMLTEIKHSKEAYNKQLKKDIGKDKFKEYSAFVDQVKLEILSESAGLRLLDVQDELEMTDEQLEKMKPVLAKGMKGILETLMEYVDKRMSVRNKLKIANSLKAIKKEIDRESSKILSPEQIAKWNEMKEEAAEKNK